MSKSLKCLPKGINLLKVSIKFTRDCLDKCHLNINYSTLPRRCQVL
jgi:hypothetical protein